MLIMCTLSGISFVLLTMHLDTIKVLFANLMHNFFIKLRSLTYFQSDDIRNQMMHIYNKVLLMMATMVLDTCRGIR